ncbi:MAG TPA: gamma-glutamyl-gamma-aminobutyrate hydrolase family protein [Vicinamibacteria bacterium]|nr:gamma-glutamyl-gamma-aminobutyrate hydrolase family protein [Vicinamibacteria bacterium]
MRRPVVGVTLGDGDEAGVHAMREDYVRSVERAGAVPVVLPPVSPEDVPALLDRLDGVLLSGGVDVDPSLYGQDPHPKLGRVHRRRDDFELALTREALRRDRPILAICRGHQVLNVATGGTLVQDIPSLVGGAVRHDGPGPRWRRAHQVSVTPSSRLREILGQESASVNSIHHQGVDRLGEGLVVSARCPDDGVVEGLEMPDRAFVVAVQWHPESFWNQDDSFQRLFDAHAGACRAAARS